MVSLYKPHRRWADRFHHSSFKGNFQVDVSEDGVNVVWLTRPLQTCLPDNLHLSKALQTSSLYDTGPTMLFSTIICWF